MPEWRPRLAPWPGAALVSRAVLAPPHQRSTSMMQRSVKLAALALIALIGTTGCQEKTATTKGNSPGATAQTPAMTTPAESTGASMKGTQAGAAAEVVTPSGLK